MSRYSTKQLDDFWWVVLDATLPPGLYHSRHETMDAAEKTIAHLRVTNAAPDLLAALKALFADYKMLADSGDCGNWHIEDQAVGKQALAAIAKAEGRS